MDKVVQKMMQYQMKVTSIIDLHSKAEDGKNLDLRLFNIDFSQHNWKMSMLSLPVKNWIQFDGVSVLCIFLKGKRGKFRLP